MGAIMNAMYKFMSNAAGAALGLLLGVMATFFGIPFGGVAQATTFTFGDGVPILVPGYTEAGMIISSVSPAFPTIYATEGKYIRDWQTTGVGYDTTGTERELQINQGDLSGGATRDVVFSLVSAGTFDLLSLDIEDPNLFSASGTLTVIGSNGATQALYGGDFGTATLLGFVGLTSFTLRCEAGCQATVDNIVFSELSTVPLPAAIPLFATGLGALGLLGWRRKRKAKAA
jgi:hypothetical protein